ncbi:MAG: lysylphosphatidylglycerol synthase domain-containing protein, partial [Candidatus Hydrogenedentes bacterium]|nr:lysylphosphatidylglycerol synthase domain-containing protein [Candidatus Hydrogenedentota bacterium]
MNPSPEEPPRLPSAEAKRRGFFTYAVWIIGVGVVAWVIWFVGWGDIRAAFGRMNPWLFAGMAGLDAAAMWVRATKWRLVLGKHHNAFGLHFLSKIAGNYSPGRVGELSPLLLKAHRTSRVGAWIVVDRLIEMTMTIAFGAVGFFLLRFSSASVLPAVLGSLFIFIFLPLVLITRRRWFEALAGKTAEGSRFRKALDGLVRLSEEVLRLRTVTPVAGLLTLAAALLELGAYLVLYRSFGAEGVTFAMVAAAKCAQGVVGALP